MKVERIAGDSYQGVSGDAEPRVKTNLANESSKPHRNSVPPVYTAILRVPGGMLLPLLSLRGERGNCSPNRTLQPHSYFDVAHSQTTVIPKRFCERPGRWGQRRRTASKGRGRESTVKLGIASCYLSDPE